MEETTGDTPRSIRNAITRVRFETIKSDVEDHERRLRIVEEAVTKFNFLIFLTMGGGLLSLINLLTMIVLIATNYAK
jgi:hypothetical protein